MPGFPCCVHGQSDDVSKIQKTSRRTLVEAVIWQSLLTSFYSFSFFSRPFTPLFLHTSLPNLDITTMATPTQEWTSEQLLSDAVSKKDIVTFLHLSASHDFLVEFKLTGKLPTVVKNGKLNFPLSTVTRFTSTLKGGNTPFQTILGLLTHLLIFPNYSQEGLAL